MSLDLSNAVVPDAQPSPRTVVEFNHDVSAITLKKEDSPVKQVSARKEKESPKKVPSI